MTILDNLKLAQKLAIGFGVCLFFAAISVIVAITRMNSMNASTRTIADQAAAEAITAGSLATDFRQYRIWQFRLILAQSGAAADEMLDSMNKAAETVDQDVDAYSKLSSDPVDRSNLDKFKQSWQQCLEFQPSIVAAARGRNYALTDHIISHDAEPSFYATRDTTISMIDWNTRRIKQLASDSQGLFESARWAMAILLLCALAIGSAIGVVITRTIRKALVDISDRMSNLNLSLTDQSELLNAMAEGDLTERDIRHTDFLNWSRGDEFGDLARVFDKTLEHAKLTLSGATTARESLAHVIAQTLMASEQIATASEQIATGNEDLSSRTAEQASSLEETAASMEEMTSVVKQSADNARNASEVAHEAAESAASASAVASESRTIALSGGQVVEKAVESMRAIEESSKKIADIVSVIDDIAFQTNLLALNAAVEAARVGEQGKGFAVVAAEVRSLAGRSSSAAKEIKALVQESVRKVEFGSEQVNKSGEQLQKIVESGEKVAAIVGSISAADQKVAEIVATISGAAQEQSAGIEQVNKAIVQMDEITQQNAALVEEAASSSEELSEQAKELRDLVRKFKVDESYLASSAEQAEPVRATGTHGGHAKRPQAPKPAQRPSLKIVKGHAAKQEMEDF